jgi:SH3-like domain-containing protein
MWWRTLGLILLLAATEARAGASALSGDEIKQTVTGAVFAVDTPLGSTLPISYGADGRMSAEAGALAYLLGSPTDSGTWWIAANRLCQKWRRWFDGAVHCLRLSQDGMRFFWRRDDGETGTATIVARPERNFTAPVVRRQLEARASAPQIALPPSPPARVATSSLPSPEGPAHEGTDVADEAPAPQREVMPQPSEVSKTDADAKAALVAKPAPVRRPTALAAAMPPPPSGRAVPSFRVAGVDEGDVLNVRNGPSAEHGVIGSILPDAGDIKIIGPCVSAWCPIQHRGITGWVNSFYLSPSER